MAELDAIAGNRRRRHAGQWEQRTELAGLARHSRLAAQPVEMAMQTDVRVTDVVDRPAHPHGVVCETPPGARVARLRDVFLERVTRELGERRLLWSGIGRRGHGGPPGLRPRGVRPRAVYPNVYRARRRMSVGCRISNAPSIKFVSRAVGDVFHPVGCVARMPRLPCARALL